MLDPKSLRPEIDLMIPAKYAGLSFSQVVKSEFRFDDVLVKRVINEMAEHILYLREEVETTKHTQMTWYASSDLKTQHFLRMKMAFEERIKALESQVFELEGKLKAA